MAVSKLKKMLQKSAEIAEPVNTMKDWLERYTIYLRSECHLADNTVQAYGRDLDRMATWLDVDRLPNSTFATFPNLSVI